MLPSDTIEVIQLLLTFFYFGDATMTFSDRRTLHRCNVASPPALRHSSCLVPPADQHRGLLRAEVIRE